MAPPFFMTITEYIERAGAFEAEPIIHVAHTKFPHLQWARLTHSALGLSTEAIELGSGSHRKATEEELWKYLPDPYVFKPKVEEVEVVEKVFLPSSEVSPDEVASIAREVAKKFTKNTIVVEEDDDEEAILLLLGVL